MLDQALDGRCVSLVEALSKYKQAPVPITGLQRSAPPADTLVESNQG